MFFAWYISGVYQTMIGGDYVAGFLCEYRAFVVLGLIRNSISEREQPFKFLLILFPLQNHILAY